MVYLKLRCTTPHQSVFLTVRPSPPSPRLPGLLPDEVHVPLSVFGFGGSGGLPPAPLGNPLRASWPPEEPQVLVDVLADPPRASGFRASASASSESELESESERKSPLFGAVVVATSRPSLSLATPTPYTLHGPAGVRKGHEEDQCGHNQEEAVNDI